MMQMQDRVGQQLGNYRLKRLIGQGGSAEVYLAEHIHLSGLQYAIKVLIGTSLQDEKREEFLLEARTIANLQHYNAHIVEIRDFGIQPGINGPNEDIPYLVMEYAREGTLRRLYPHGTQMPMERIIFYVEQVAEALQCTHDQNPPVVHCDIKPENMLLRSTDYVLLSDFGIAVTGKTGNLTISAKDANIVGTATYIAPERFSHQARRASDQYSLAVVIYEWLCGLPPFDGNTKEICFKHLTAPPPPLYPTYPHVTKEIEDVVMKALAKKPEDRYPTVQAFALALEDAVQLALGQSRQAQQPLPQRQSVQPEPMLPSLSSQPTRVQSDMGETLKANPVQLPGSHPHPIPYVATEPFSPQMAQQVVLPPPINPATKPTRSLSKKVRDFFGFSSQFSRDRRYSFFRTWGIILNILSAAGTGMLLWNSNTSIAIGFACGGLIFSLLMFMLCVRAIEETVAIFFGTLVAVYWGGVGWVFGGALAPLLYPDTSFLRQFLGFIFFVISFSLHFWYVQRKNT